MENFKKHLSGQDAPTIEYRLVCKNGKKLDVIINTKLITYQKDKVILGIVTDITERKRTEQSLRENEELLRGITQNIPGIVFQVSLEKNNEFKVNYLSGNSMKYAGLDNHDPDIINHFVNGLAEEVRFNFLTLQNETIEKMSQWEWDGKYIRPDGKEMYFHGVSQPKLSCDKIIFDGVFLDETNRKRAEDALRESTERFDFLANFSRAFIWETDAEGLYTYVNDVVKELTGFLPGEIIGKKHFYDLHPEDGREAFKMTAFEIFSRKQPFRGLVNSMQTKDSKICWISTNGAPIIGNNGSLLGYKGIDIDITERKLATDKFTQLANLNKTILDTITVGLAYVIGRKIQWSNSAFYKMFGYEYEELIGHSTARLYKDEELYKSIGKEAYAQFTKVETYYSTEALAKKKDGTLFWVSLSAKAIDPDRPMEGSVWMVLDIDKRKLMEKQIIDARDSAERSDKLKDVFLQNISHEIRTPLNAIVGFSELLNSEEDITKESVKHYTSIINNSSQQLLSIVSDILTISGIQTGQISITLEQVDINKMFDHLYEIFLPVAREKKLKLSVSRAVIEGPFFTYSDETKLTQILTNLLNNAVKFTLQGSIEIIYKHQGEKIVFCVKDTGVGIPGESQDIIFERFRQADPSIGINYGGTGLGLSISKSFAEMLNGKMWVESEQGKGSSFFLSIPYKPLQNEILEEKPGQVELPGFPVTILIAEDEISNYLLLETLLKDDKITILHASNGLEAVKMCRNNLKIDLVVMDIKMPEMDGLTAFLEIRKFRKNLPVIALTAFALIHERQHFLDLGFSDYISKPVAKAALLEKINCVVNSTG